MKNTNYTNDKYLNNDFLNTASFIKTNENKPSVSYMVFEETKLDSTPQEHVNSQFLSSNSTYGEISVKVKKEEIELSKTIVEKNSPDSLVNHLSKTLYNTYIELANSNEKSLANQIIPTKRSKFINMIKNYVQGDAMLILDSSNMEASMRRLITRILMVSNSIAINTRRGSANFIIIDNDELCGMLSTFLANFTPNLKASNQLFSLIGSFADFIVFKKNYFTIPLKGTKYINILVGRKESNTYGNGVFIIEKDTIINENNIEWLGAIYAVSDTAKHNYDSFKILIDKNLPWHKKLLYKYLKYKKVYG